MELVPHGAELVGTAAFALSGALLESSESGEELMEFVYPVTYLKCQSCDAKNHCARCSAELMDSLMRSGEVEWVMLDLEKKTVRIVGEDEDALLDALDDRGIFTY